jgi:ParB family chromosome partitioning protein
MGKKKEIGKGIRALLANIEQESNSTPETTQSENKANVAVDIRLIEANPFQPRTEFDEEKLSDLCESIKTFGVIQPITLRKLSNKKYQIISGERRWRASKLAGLTEVPAYVREADDQGMLEMALLENIQRADLNPLEVAISYQRLIDECDLTHEELSQRLGKKRSSISNYLRVLKLSPSAQKALKLDQISLGHAKVLVGIEPIENQIGILEEILSKGLSVRATEQLIQSKKGSNNSGSASTNKEIHPEVRKYQDQLADKVGIKVAISRNDKGKGSIKINFKNDHELNQIMESLL